MRGERRRPTPHLGDFLHPRNRYKANPPNFYALGERYPSFLQYLRNINHERRTASLPFDDPYAARELTRTLLKHDFGLEWTIPIDRLCPPLPNRLNYLHWIEDLLHQCGVDPFQSVHGHAIRGIDIGTGASCIYALLGAKTNRWHFLATEIDAVSFESAKENVETNQLTDLISVQRVSSSRLLEEPIAASNNQHSYHFSMCNPPFFGDIDEADTNPDASCMGSSSEMACPGGEVAFIKDMIVDSVKLRDRVLIYTSMIGRKASLRLVLAVLREHEIRNVCTTEFFQGRTKRWGIAWTFAEDVSLNEQVKVLGKRKESQRRQETSFEVPMWTEEVEYGCRSMQEVLDRMKDFITSQSPTITFTEEQINSHRITLNISTLEDTKFAGEITCDESNGCHVQVKYGSGTRDAFWRFADELKAATIRSGRHWRRKRKKQEHSSEPPH
ncbi:hypothetical protein Poli38472_003691 [Pythium oligandrum]|uniref:U6 small nuclear RNA (adenine-(43)-N(6))-methyltransferase n=1 Tax=Pythium oligandrum TaxID=41045 RepID=A0A8K1FKD2_PYTOL|nr:hypothetical protein Poli38472_003691 [Pythium oligandrum]|eukprot:TMW65926.1 hypothetical protein Poli38472_003691 [Pythium oligandrum]